MPGGPPIDVALFDAYPHALAGAQQVAIELAEGLAGRGVAVLLVTPGGGPAVDAARRRGVPVRVIDAPDSLRLHGERWRAARAALGAGARLPGYWRRLARTFRSSRVVHIDDPRGLVLASGAARLARRPIVWHLHSADDDDRLLRLGARLADVTVVPDDRAQAPPGALVIPNPQRTVVAPADPDPQPTIVAVGRAHPNKGWDLLVDAFEQLRAQRPDARLVLVGGDEPGHESFADLLDARVAEVGAVERVGWVDDPLPHLGRAWVVAQPSRHESVPRVPREAAAVGRPVVASDIAPHRLLDGSVTLVKADDPGSLADALDRALGAGPPSAEPGPTGPSTDQIIDRWLAVYAGLA